MYMKCGVKMKIKEVIVVEGKNDTNVLQSYVECDTLETHGSALSQETLCQIREMQETRGVIIFTDPDYPGEMIRRKINQFIPGCKNAFIEKGKAKTTKKVGVEHAKKEDILDALKHLMTYDEEVKESLSYEEFIDLGLVGGKEAAKHREEIGRILYLGKPNAKTLYKRLNMIGYTKEDVLRILKGTEA